MPRIICCRVLLHLAVRHASGPSAAIVQGWITAISTLVLALLAIATAVVAGLALRKQSRGLAIVAEQNDRDIAERHKAQAARVYTGVQDVRPRNAHPYATNGSDFPVYDAQLWQADPGVVSDPENIGMIPPGSVAESGRQISYQEALETTVLTFRDAAGAHWMRMPNGTLKEQTHPTARQSILAALGRPLAEPADSAGQPERPEEI
jgi:hypothetical protein